MALAFLGQSFSTPTDCSKIMSRLERWVSTLLFFRGDRWLSDFITSILKGWCLFLKVYPKGNKHILSRPLRRGLEKSEPYRHHTLTGKYLSQVQTFFTTFFCATLALAHKTVPVVHQMTSTASEFDKCFCCARLESSVFCHSAIESKGGVGRAILPTFVLQHIQEIYVYIILYIYKIPNHTTKIPEKFGIIPPFFQCNHWDSLSCFVFVCLGLQNEINLGHRNQLLCKVMTFNLQYLATFPQDPNVARRPYKTTKWAKWRMFQLVASIL